MVRISDCSHGALARSMSAVALSATLLFAFGVPAVARAQSVHDEYRVMVRSAYLDKSAAFNGYRDGYDHGVADAGSGASFAPQLGDSYQLATAGYTPDLGSVGQYQTSFRRAYAQGYSDSFSGRARDITSSVPPSPYQVEGDNAAWSHRNNPNPEDLPIAGDPNDSAETRGYDAGYANGTGDNDRGAQFEYRNSEIYQSATQGYDERRGDLEGFQSTFRQAYARGYSDGFNGRASYTRTRQVYGYGDRRDPVQQELTLSDIVRLATASGYHDGFERGASNRSSRRSSAYRRDDVYRQATSGYDESWNAQRPYQNAYRQGYSKGFSDGYYRRSRNSDYEAIYGQHRRGGYDYGNDSYSVKDYRPGYGVSNTLAGRSAETGYRVGYERGRYDRTAGVRSPNPQSHGAYEFGLDGWEQDLGDRAAYQSRFREYFIRGYQDGYDGRAGNFAVRP